MWQIQNVMQHIFFVCRINHFDGLNLSFCSQKFSSRPYNSAQFNIFILGSCVAYSDDVYFGEILKALVKSERWWGASVKDPSGLSLPLSFINAVWQPDANPVGSLSLFWCHSQRKCSQGKVSKIAAEIRVWKNVLSTLERNDKSMKSVFQCSNRVTKHVRTTDL